MRRVLVNGVDGAGVPADDPGFTLGMSAFESLRTYGAAPFRLREHLERLADSCAALDIPYPGDDALNADIVAAIDGAADVYVRVTLTGGGNQVIAVSPIDMTRIGAPLRLATVTWEPPSWLPGTVKHGSRAAWIVACRQLGVDEVMFVDGDSNVLECNRSNVFAIIGGRLHTPELGGGLLAGVTRAALLQAAKKVGIPTRIGPLRRFIQYDELYVSSTLKELAPVVELDGQPLPCWGPIGERLADAFRDIVYDECGAPHDPNCD